MTGLKSLRWLPVMLALMVFAGCSTSNSDESKSG